VRRQLCDHPAIGNKATKASVAASVRRRFIRQSTGGLTKLTSYYDASTTCRAAAEVSTMLLVEMHAFACSDAARWLREDAVSERGVVVRRTTTPRIAQSKS